MHALSIYVWNLNRCLQNMLSIRVWNKCVTRAPGIRVRNASEHTVPATMPNCIYAYAYRYACQCASMPDTKWLLLCLSFCLYACLIHCPTASGPQILQKIPVLWMRPSWVVRGASDCQKSQQSWVRSQHPPTQWNLRDAIVERSLYGCYALPATSIILTLHLITNLKISPVLLIPAFSRK